MVETESQSSNPYSVILPLTLPDKSEAISERDHWTATPFYAPILDSWASNAFIEPLASSTPLGEFSRLREDKELVIDPDELEMPFQPKDAITMSVGGPTEFPEPEWEL